MRLLWVTLMPIVVVVVPWIAAWVTHGGRQAAIVAAVWLGCLLLAAFVAMGPGIAGLLGLSVVQLARTPWQPSRL